MPNKLAMLHKLQANMPLTKRLLHARQSEMLERFGLSQAQFEAFFALHHAGEEPVTTKVLAQQLHVTPGAISPIIESLVQIGYAKRSNDNVDRRIFHLELTSKGKQVAKQIHADKRVLLHDVLSSLSTEELATLIRLQERIIEKLQNENQSHNSKETA